MSLAFEGTMPDADYGPIAFLLIFLGGIGAMMIWALIRVLQASARRTDSTWRR
jgi:hypothetical protein